MASTTTEQKLSKIFPQLFQIKRLMKQINDLKQMREKGAFDIKMSVLKNQCLIFKVEIMQSAYKGTKLPEIMTKMQQDFKIIVRKSYPATPPRLFFMHDNMTKYGFKPFRDYMPQLLGNPNEWSAKVTIMHLIKSIPPFLEKTFLSPSLPQKYPIFQQYFQLDTIYSWKFCQLYPIKLQKRTTSKQGFMYIDVMAQEIVILDDVGVEVSYGISDYVRGKEIVSLRRKRNGGGFLMEVKLGYERMTGRYGIEFSSQDYQALLIAIMDCAKLSEDARKMSESDPKNNESSSQQNDQQTQQNSNQNQKKPNSSSQTTVNISELAEEILIYESLVDSKMTSENLSQLVTLLQKAIQYYSALSDDRFTIYLNKLQTILSNQVAQALLESANEAKKGKNGPKANKGKEVYSSIVDLL